jgi:hypothetical protein
MQAIGTRQELGTLFAFTGRATAGAGVRPLADDEAVRHTGTLFGCAKESRKQWRHGFLSL